MKTFLFAIACSLLSVPALAQQAEDAAKSEPADAKPAAQAADHAAPAAGAAKPAQETHAKDANYRWFNGRWWYWQNGGYLLWDGTRWVPPAERQASANARRSFSYVEGATAAPATGVSSNPAFNRRGYYPGSVANERILPSFGFRSAGSKAQGNY